MSAENRYITHNKLGEGTYATVYRGQNKTTGAPSTAIREISLVKELNHPNIVKLLDVIHTETRLTITRGFNGALDPTIIKKFMYQLLSGLAYCHDSHYPPPRPETSDLLIDAHQILRSGTLGWRVRSAFGGLVFQRAPDVLLGSRNYSTAIDLWSVGCIMAELYLGRPLFPGLNNDDQLLRIFRLLGTPSEQTWPTVSQYTNWHGNYPYYPPTSIAQAIPTHSDYNALDLIMRFLQYQPQHRLSAHEALEHPYFLGLVL
ncbi:negative regulator of the PHO system [Massospora cicadina]|nr:negative regulator of the PHO system [Massospora cicadina]